MASQIVPTSIDITFPLVGQDNDPRGFHTNYRAIQLGLSTARTEITDLQANVDSLVNGNFTSNVTFSGNVATISNVNNISTVSMVLSSAIQLAQMTTTERNAISATNGMMIYNTTFNKFQGYASGAWGNITLT